MTDFNLIKYLLYCRKRILVKKIYDFIIKILCTQ